MEVILQDSDAPFHHYMEPSSSPSLPAWPPMLDVHPWTPRTTSAGYRQPLDAASETAFGEGKLVKNHPERMMGRKWCVATTGLTDP